MTRRSARLPPGCSSNRAVTRGSQDIRYSNLTSFWHHAALLPNISGNDLPLGITSLQPPPEVACLAALAACWLARASCEMGITRRFLLAPCYTCSMEDGHRPTVADKDGPMLSKKGLRSL